MNEFWFGVGEFLLGLFAGILLMRGIHRWRIHLRDQANAENLRDQSKMKGDS